MKFFSSSPSLVLALLSVFLLLIATTVDAAPLPSTKAKREIGGALRSAATTIGSKLSQFFSKTPNVATNAATANTLDNAAVASIHSAPSLARSSASSSTFASSLSEPFSTAKSARVPNLATVVGVAGGSAAAGAGTAIGVSSAITDNRVNKLRESTSTASASASASAQPSAAANTTTSPAMNFQTTQSTINQLVTKSKDSICKNDYANLQKDLKDYIREQIEKADSFISLKWKDSKLDKNAFMDRVVLEWMGDVEQQILVICPLP